MHSDQPYDAKCRNSASLLAWIQQRDSGFRSHTTCCRASFGTKLRRAAHLDETNPTQQAACPYDIISQRGARKCNLLADGWVRNFDAKGESEGGESLA